MQTRHTRFELRFESGKRAGERCELGEGKHTLGRAADNTLPLADASVSGHHAELLVSAGEVRVIDLGSTNGTRVGGRRVESARLAHGDRLSVGNVELVLHDLRFEQGLAAPTVLAEPALARAVRGRGGRPWLLVSLVLVLVAALAVWQLRARARRAPDAVVKAVPEVPGNLLADGSFEGEDEPAWESASAAPRALRRAARHAASGAAGLGVELGLEEWSFARSAPFALGGARALRLVAALRAEDSAGAEAGGALRLGLERLTPDGRALLSWSAPVQASAAFEPLVLDVPVAPGQDRARVVLAARGPGTFSLDDASVVRAEAPAASAAFLEDQLFASGERPTALAVVRGGRTVLEAALTGWSEDGLHGPGSGWLRAEALEDGFRIGVEAGGAGESLTLCLEASGEEPWAATLGPAGFRSHAGELAAEAATDVFLGAGTETVRVALGEGRTLDGRLDGARLRLTLPIEDGASVRVQLRFRSELVEADQLRERALAAEAEGEPARALELWGEILARVPVRGALVREAQAASTRLLASGLERIEEVRREVQRARFFELAALYRETLRRAEDVAQAYRGTELQAIAEELAGEVALELRAGVRRQAELESERVRALLGSRRVTSSTALAERLRAELARLAEQAPPEEGGR